MTLFFNLSSFYRYFAEYKTFKVASEADKYRLTIGGYSGTAGNSMGYCDGAAFSTRDRDNDGYSGSCAVLKTYGNGGGFWYKTCGYAYPNSPSDGTNGFIWAHLPISITTTSKKLLYIQMTIKPN